VDCVCVCRGDDQACVVGSPRGYFDLFVLLCFVLGRGNFSCGVSRVPALEEVVTHLRKHGFLPLMTGDNGTERKLYVVCVCVCYAFSVVSRGSNSQHSILYP